MNFENVDLKIEREQILRDINIKIHEGEFVYFVGASGAGKSSLIKMIYRESKNSKGTLTVLDKNVTKLRQRHLPELRRKVGVVFQDFKLLPDKTIYENVKFSLDVTGYPRKKKHEQVLKVLRQVGIASHKDKYPNELSGGQQQRAAIARAIVDEPSILVCDEPTGNLDPENAIQIMEIITDINENGTTVLMATHDVGIVNKYKHRVVLMKNGRISNEGEGEYIYE
ncbi:ATP-binding cassette domain-containing protein [Mollicutes bacterium LVI A0039]|nr:ATP-binding cassette domain-containing protein [Mollicutes bacterium LVI A0039]